MTAVATTQEGKVVVDGRREPSTDVRPEAFGPMADARVMQTIHEAVEAARRFGLVRENY